MGLRKWAITVLVVLVILSLIAPGVAWSAGKRLVTIGDMFIGGESANGNIRQRRYSIRRMQPLQILPRWPSSSCLDGGTSIAATIAQTTAATGGKRYWLLHGRLGFYVGG